MNGVTETENKDELSHTGALPSSWNALQGYERRHYKASYRLMMRTASFRLIRSEKIT